LDQGVARYFGIVCNQLSDKAVVRQLAGRRLKAQRLAATKDRIRRFPASRVECTFIQILVQSRYN
jgi:hypothetical protein